MGYFLICSLKRGTEQTHEGQTRRQPSLEPTPSTHTNTVSLSSLHVLKCCCVHTQEFLFFHSHKTDVFKCSFVKRKAVFTLINREGKQFYFRKKSPKRQIWRTKVVELGTGLPSCAGTAHVPPKQPACF